MSLTTVDFANIKVETPTIEQVKTEYQSINTALDTAKTKADKEQALQKWDDLRRRLETWSSLTSLHFSQDTRNKAYKKAQDYSDELQPKLTALAIEMKRKLLASEDKAELEAILGQQAFSLWSADITTFETVIEDDLVKESKLVNQYIELLASAEINFAGDKVNLSGIRKYSQDRDRSNSSSSRTSSMELF